MAIAQLLLTHGAGAGIESAFMGELIVALEARNIAVTAFNFDYMTKQISQGKKRPPSRAPKLSEEFKSQIDGVSTQAITQQYEAYWLTGILFILRVNLKNAALSTWVHFLHLWLCCRVNGIRSESEKRLKNTRCLRKSVFGF